MKKCSDCKETKQLSEFSSDSSRLDGYCYICRNCQRRLRTLKSVDRKAELLLIKQLNRWNKKIPNKLEMGFIAGIIDGEGSFSSSNNSHKIVVQMNDKDTIERLKEYSGVGNIYGPRIRENWQPSYVWQVSKREDLLDVLMYTVPLLSERRRDQVSKLLDNIAS